MGIIIYRKMSVNILELADPLSYISKLPATYKAFEYRCRAIDEMTGDVSLCVKLLEAGLSLEIPGLKELYKLYMQYFILIYEEDLNISSISQLKQIDM
jgi:hypothetical protein